MSDMFNVPREYQAIFLEGIVEPLGCDASGMRMDYNGTGDPGVTTPDFVIRPYDWNEPDEPAPNFEWRSRGVNIWWYKYPLRGAESNVPITLELLHELVYAVENYCQPNAGSS